MALPRKILHIDLDAFFCSVEEQLDPSLKGKAFAVGGRPEERGVVASCSYPARGFGIRSAMPMVQAIRRCPELIIVSGHYAEYRRASGQVMDILRDISPVLEQISIDEAFLDLTDLSQPADEIARQVHERINSELHLPCSLGLSSNKLVAKIATDYGKAVTGTKEYPPNAFQAVPLGGEAAFLAPLPLEALWGIGPKTSQKLAGNGIKTIGDLAKIQEKQLIERFGKMGHDLFLRAKGIDERPVIGEHSIKSISQETTFPKDVRDKDSLVQILHSLSNKVSRQLVRKHLEARTVKIKIRWPDFTTISRQVTLNQPTNRVEKISDAASQLFQEAWKPGQPVRLIGVGVTGIAPLQLKLWGEESIQVTPEKESRLNAVLNDLYERYGPRVIVRGQDLEK